MNRLIDRLLLYTKIEHNPTLTPEEKKAFYFFIGLMDLIESKNSKEDSTKI